MVVRISKSSNDALAVNSYKAIWEREDRIKKGDNSNYLREQCANWLQEHDVREIQNIVFVMRMCAASEGQFLHSTEISKMMSLSQLSSDQVLTVFQRSLLYDRHV